MTSSRTRRFSKLDLISCAISLIYMGAELQKKPDARCFTTALNPGGMLVLGILRELWEELCDLFEPIERKSRIYQRKAHDFRTHRIGIPGLFERPPGNEVRTAGRERRVEREQASVAADRGTNPSGALLPRLGALVSETW